MSVKGVELFAGGGGLLLGSALAGVEHLAAAEWNRWACQTIRENEATGHPLVKGIQVLEGDVNGVSWSEVLGNRTVDLVTGGPPCQPFSLGGKARSADDDRDMFPATAHVIAELKPKAFVVENVKGLTRSSFSDYFRYIQLRLQHPEVVAHEHETWFEHYSRLVREDGLVTSDLQYRLSTHLVDAADYGVPQRRHRVFMIGFREDISSDSWQFPEVTHSAAALHQAQISGDYWQKYDVPQSQQHVIRMKKGDPLLKPWKTVRDGLLGLPHPLSDSASSFFDHTYQPGAKAYPGHTGSPIDEPSKALKAGVHGVPGGENMVRYHDGSVRYYSTREAARMQMFPDDYRLHGSWTEAMRQIGNAVPVELARIVVSSVTQCIESQTKLT